MIDTGAISFIQKEVNSFNEAKNGFFVDRYFF